MISDITIGQFYPINSPIHKLDARFKLLALIAYIVIIFCVNSLASLCFAVALTLFAVFMSRVPLKVYLKNIKSILLIIILTTVLNMFYVKGGDLLISFFNINIYYLGVRKAVYMTMRITLLIIISSLLTYTTTPTALTDAIERLLSPLRFIGLGNAVHTLAMMMTIALRFIPTLIHETEKLMNAQKARGADFESGSLIKRAKSLLPILIPLFISSVRRAFDLSEAMESRCYSGNYIKERLKQLHFGKADAVATLIIVVSIALTFVLNNISILP